MTLDRARTAVLSLDVQQGIFAFVPGAKAIVPAAVSVVEQGRRAGIRVIHVGLGFEPGYPEVSPRHRMFSMLKDKALFLKGSESATIHPAIVAPGETIVYKHRVSGFSGNALRMILSAGNIDTLVLFGIATSGIVLSTLRAASDLDFTCLVVKDACFDGDPEVHRVLTEKVFAAQAKVVTAQELGSELASA